MQKILLWSSWTKIDKLYYCNQFWNINTSYFPAYFPAPQLSFCFVSYVGIKIIVVNPKCTKEVMRDGERTSNLEPRINKEVVVEPQINVVLQMIERVMQSHKRAITLQQIDHGIEKLVEKIGLFEDTNKHGSANWFDVAGAHWESRHWFSPRLTSLWHFCGTMRK